MATRRVEAFLFPLSSCSSTPAASWLHPPDLIQRKALRHGVQRHSEQQQRKLCVHWCLDDSSEQESGKEHNPYYFGRRSYQQWSRTEHGRLRVFRARGRGIIKITEDQIRALNESKTESWPLTLK
ncbi:unnamed protein product [Musa acuminata subsp. burmannicoides]